MKSSRMVTGLLAMAVSLSFLLSCSFMSDVDEPQQQESGIIRKAKVTIDPGMTEYLTDLVDSNGGDEIVLDLTIDAEYQYVLERLSIAGKTRSSSPQLFKEVEKARQFQQARRSRGDTREKASELDGHSIVKFIQKDDGTFFVSAAAGVQKTSEYIFLDTVAKDDSGNSCTEYVASETFANTYLSCDAQGSAWSRSTRAVGDYINADTMMCYMTKDLDGDGEDDPGVLEPVLKITYAYSDTSVNSTYFAKNLILYHPVENNAGDGDQDATNCRICLGRNAVDCDYDLSILTKLYPDLTYNVRDPGEKIILPFTGEITFEGKIVPPDPLSLELPAQYKPNGDQFDDEGHNRRDVDLFLAIQNAKPTDPAGYARLNTPETTAFFWNHPNTIASYDKTTKMSTLKWNLYVNFGRRVFTNSQYPKFFVKIDVPIWRNSPEVYTARAFIIPENNYDDTPFKYNPFLTQTAVSPGVHNLAIYSKGKDPAKSQLISNATNYTWEVDCTPPVAADLLILNKPPTVTANKTAQISVKGIDGSDVVGYQFKLDGIRDEAELKGSWSETKDIAEPIMIDTSAENYTSLLYTLYVVGVDRAGNKQDEATAVTHTWMIRPNNGNPEARLSNLPAFFSKASAATITVSGASNVVRYNYQLSGRTKVSDCPIDQPIHLPGLSEGKNVLQVWARTANLTQAVATSYTWYVDYTPPVAELYMAKAPDNKTCATDFSAEVGGVDVVQYEYKIDSGTSETDSIKNLITTDQALSAGMHTLTVWGIDRAGNKQTTPTTYTWTVDPSLAYIVMRDLPRAFTNVTGLNIKLSGDEVVTYRYRLDESLWTVDIPLQDLMTMPLMNFRWSCVAADTEIRMADGTLKKISTIKEGEWVLSDNHTTLPVSIITTGEETIPMYRINDQYSNSLLLTQGHPVIMADNSRKLARDLMVGDKIRTEYGPSELTSVTTEKYDGKIYNLSLGTREQMKSNNYDGYVMFANGMLIGDNNMQTKEMNLGSMSKEERLALIPQKWMKDYMNSPASRIDMSTH